MNTDEIIAKGIKGSTAKGRGLYSLIPTIMLIMTVSLLVACGGSSSPATSESVVARGVITQLGSIWVNGVEYETPPGGSYSSDDDPNFDPTLYQVGQVVSLRGRRNDDGVSGIADEVEYEAEIEGAAGADNTINGVTIITDQTLTPSMRYEVSGFWINDKTLEATFIKVDDDSNLIDEVKGEVDVVVPATSITVNGVVYLWDDASDFSVGNIVEVHFDPLTCSDSPVTCNASDVELEDDLLDNPDDGLEAEIEGPVNLTKAEIDLNCPNPTTSFMIDFTCIDWESVDRWEDGLESSDDLVSGLRVEAEGHFIIRPIGEAKVLIAEKIKGRGNQVRISAIASGIAADTEGTTGSLVVFDGVAAPIDVTFESGMTEIDFNGDPNLLSANPTAEGLEIRGIRTDVTSILALRIKDDSVNANRQELRAVVDDNGANPATATTLATITVMGISSLLDSNTQLEDEDFVMGSGGGSTTPTQINDFLEMIDDDGIVTITNGPNDVVEVRIDTTNGGNNDGVGSTVSPYAAKQVEIEREDD